jgi:formate hydrogenlyase subunit 3/multisubunit Na+/H+ antiporter MnhD subunit
MVNKLWLGILGFFCVMLGYYTFMASARMWTKWSKNEQRDDSQKTLKPTKLSVTVAGLVIFSVGVGMILKYFGII